MQTTITPKYVDQPKAGKKNWSVKEEAGVSFSVPPKFAPQFRVGLPVTADYSLSHYNGKDFNMVEGATITNPPTAYIPTPAPHQPSPPVPVPGSQYQPPQPAPAHHANGASLPKAYGSTDAATAERIFVCGVVNSCIK